VNEYAINRTAMGDALVAYCLLELRKRGAKLEHVTYEALRTGYRHDDFMFQAPSEGNVSVAEMNPSAILPRLLASASRHSMSKKN
jgi:hypothetical protein